MSPNVLFANWTKIWTNRLIAAEAKEAEAREAAAKLAPQEIETPDSEEETELNGSKVVVIHIGSRTMRIGFASDTFPINVPMVIVRPTIAPPEENKLAQPVRLREDPDSQDPLFGQALEDGVTKLDAIFKARLKAAKKRTVPNARELVASYNRKSQWEEILDINDPEQIEWIDLRTEKNYVTGAAVFPRTPLYPTLILLNLCAVCRLSESRRIRRQHDITGLYNMVCLMRLNTPLDRNCWVISNS